MKRLLNPVKLLNPRVDDHSTQINDPYILGSHNIFVLKATNTTTHWQNNTVQSWSLYLQMISIFSMTTTTIKDHNRPYHRVPEWQKSIRKMLTWQELFLYLRF